MTNSVNLDGKKNSVEAGKALLDRLLGHDAWTTGYLLDLVQKLSDEQLDREFDLGHQTLRRTIGHVIDNIGTWTDLMNVRTAKRHQPEEDSLPALRRRYDMAVWEFGNTARMLNAEQKLDETYMDVLDQPPRAKTFGGTILHVLTHNHAHRTEILHMLERLGVQGLIEGDMLGWEQRERERNG